MQRVYGDFALVVGKLQFKDELVKGRQADGLWTVISGFAESLNCTLRDRPVQRWTGRAGHAYSHNAGSRHPRWPLMLQPSARGVIAIVIR